MQADHRKEEGRDRKISDLYAICERCAKFI